jgi:hypothetical protein
MYSRRLASLTAEPDKPCQADGAMTAVIAPDFGVAVLMSRRSPCLGTRQAIVENLGENSAKKGSAGVKKGRNARLTAGCVRHMELKRRTTQGRDD